MSPGPASSTGNDVDILNTPTGLGGALRNPQRPAVMQAPDLSTTMAAASQALERMGTMVGPTALQALDRAGVQITVENGVVCLNIPRGKAAPLSPPLPGKIVLDNVERITAKPDRQDVKISIKRKPDRDSELSLIEKITLRPDGLISWKPTASRSPAGKDLSFDDRMKRFLTTLRRVGSKAGNSER